jgi:hypothetical protein
LYAYAAERSRVAIHRGAVTALRVHKNGLECVSASRDGSIAVFHAVTGDILQHFNGDPDPQGQELSVSAVALAEYLHHDDILVRKMAANALKHVAEAGDYGAVKAIALKLNHSDPSIRELVLEPLESLLVKGDALCIAAVARMLLIQNADVRKSASIAMQFAVASEAEQEVLEKIANKILASFSQSTVTPVAVVADFLLEKFDFLDGEHLADFLRNWDRTKDSGMQLMMMLAVMNLGSFFESNNLPGIYGLLRHVNAEVRTLAGHVLAKVTLQDPAKYLWDAVAHTVVEAHSSDVDTSFSAKQALHEVLANHLFSVLEQAIDKRDAEFEAAQQVIIFLIPFLSHQSDLLRQLCVAQPLRPCLESPNHTHAQPPA